MANSEHLSRLHEGTASWNRWRAANHALEPDLTAAQLPRINLSAADLRNAHLAGASLVGADFVAERVWFDASADDAPTRTWEQSYEVSVDDLVRAVQGARFLASEHRMLQRYHHRYGDVFAVKVWPFDPLVVEFFCSVVEELQREGENNRRRQFFLRVWPHGLGRCRQLR